jgi:chitinase
MFSSAFPSRLLSASFIVLMAMLLIRAAPAKKADDFAVIAYYAGNGQDLDKYRWEQVTHVIYSFCHLKGQELAVDNAKDSIAIRKLVALKKQHKDLKVLLSLGGWGGCKTCSPVFATAEGRKIFARSVKKLSKTYQTDGLDLDWEYPGIQGVPGHPFMAEDQQNFTLLVKQLRKQLGKKAVLSFAAGGFKKYFDQSIEWEQVMPMVDYVNLMSYDLVGGYSKVTGHHTPLYSNKEQSASADYGVRYLLDLGVPARKIVIGAAFYGRSWKGVKNENKGLYQSGTFKSFIPHHRFDEVLSTEKGFVFYRDPVSKAPYAYSAERQEFATFDDPVSIALKTRYAMEQGLGGIMFWQMTDDRADGSLLNAIHQVVHPE